MTARRNEPASPPVADSTRRVWPLALLILAVLLTFGRIVENDFVNWDDDVTVSNNPYLRPVSWQNVAQFWRKSYFGRYMPVAFTFYSVEAWFAGGAQAGSSEIQFNPAFFHAGSLLLHLACVLAVYRLLMNLIGQTLPACLGALLFALHPLQVEPVAWISDQGGLLAALFSLGSLLAYLKVGAGLPPPAAACRTGASQAQSRNTIVYYGIASFAFLAAILAKPTAVSLPLLAAVLDCCLLRRHWKTTALLLIPWLVLAMGVAWFTRQQQSDSPAWVIAPLVARPLVAGDALQFYLTKLVWPLDLCILYQRSPRYVMSQPTFYVNWLLPASVGGLVIWRWRRAGLFAVGWVLAALLPVLGLVPFSYQQASTVADRYAYLALIGPAFLLATWLVAESKRAKAAGVGIVLCALALLSFFQTQCWRSSGDLFRHTLQVNPYSEAAHTKISSYFAQQGDLVGAERHLERALELNPRFAQAVFNRGALYQKVGNTAKAAEWFQRTIELDPNFRYAYVNLGVIRLDEGRLPEAISLFDAALKIEPEDELAGLHRGSALERLGREEAAIEQFRQVVQVAPYYQPARLRLAMLLVAQGELDEATAQFETILEQRDDLSVHAELAAALQRRGDFPAALAHYREALKQPSAIWPAAAARAAWLLATCPLDDVRSGRQAVVLAEHACRMQDPPTPEILQALAAAKAEVGDFEAAISQAQRAQTRARELGQPVQSEEIEEQLQSYRDHRPFREHRASHP